MTRVPLRLVLGLVLGLLLGLVPGLLLALLESLLLPLSPASAAPRPVLSWPLSGSPVVDRPFQPPTSAYGAGHRGVDLRASLGEPVLAADAGRVGYAGLLAGRGVVVVTHAGGLRTTYEPVTAAVRVGQVVARGAVLGGVATGHASCLAGTTCLHWGLLRGEEYLDPLALVGAGPVRLLPVDGADPSQAGPPPAGPPPAGALPAGALPDVAAPEAATGAGARPAVDHPSPGALAPARTRPGWSRAARGVGAVAAGGALLLGISLLRPGPLPVPPAPGAVPGALPLPEPAVEQEPPPPVDLLGERRRRRSA
ncbi:MAG: murein hydrolase activator EnvC family protein [Mycobacteriales bacterium]